MLVASSRVGLLDRYRIPYRVEPRPADGLLRIAREDGTGPELLSLAGGSADQAQPYVLDRAFLYVALPDQTAIKAVLDASGRSWTELAPIFDRSGAQRGAVLEAPDGSIFLPFDIDVPLDALLEERYQGEAGVLRKTASRIYYAVRPLLPSRARLALRRFLRRIQDRSALLAWPVETSFHRLGAVLLALIERVAGEPLPWVPHWPDPYSWALVLTHDVERAGGYGSVSNLRAVEQRFGLRSAWYFVPERDYRVEESVLEALRASGCEIGLHGLRHDGRDMTPEDFPARSVAMRAYADRWGATGFRGPSTYRDRELIQQLGVEHDSSWADVARYEPQPGGCCSWLPYFIGDVVELPITLPQDHTLFDIYRERTEASWLDKAAFLRQQGGMALILTHPDYVHSPERLAAYERFLAPHADDPDAWIALPHEVAAWWRRRADSHIERRDGSWTIVGPAATEVQVRLGAPEPAPPSAGIAR
jgi:peptidoglycan/xylan/chitin deacetylase (PgdA/CDA1 family)